MSDLFFILTFVAALGSALNAGLFFIFSVCVMQALGLLAPADGIRAMQSINRTIINPLFLGAFLGTALLSLAVIVVAIVDWGTGAGWAIAGAVTYLVTSIAVTRAFNIPLNNAVDRANPGDSESVRIWARYLDIWTKWNHVRSVGTLAATAFFILALA
jgi:uncharacterized membrane protein